MDRRCPAWSWPLAISQKERLSYSIGSPLTLDSLEISLGQVGLNGCAS